MASGKTIALIGFNRMMNWRLIEDRETRPRDRSLRGKDRIRARKAANKMGKR